MWGEGVVSAWRLSLLETGLFTSSSGIEIATDPYDLVLWNWKCSHWPQLLHRWHRADLRGRGVFVLGIIKLERDAFEQLVGQIHPVRDSMTVSA
jgi:hypothetical protein